MSGIFGAISLKKNINVFPTIYSGLYALQHRGQESMGVSLLDNEKLSEIRGKGKIADNIKFDNIGTLEGYVGVGHIKYPFNGEDKSLLPMPWLFYTNDKTKKLLISIDGVFLSDLDMDEIVENLNKDIEEVKNFVSNLRGAYSIIMISENKMVVIRDPYGIKPICVGKKKDIILASSESCGIDAVDGEFYRDLEPGEIYIVEDNKEKSYYAKNYGCNTCIFEMVYTARPDSIIDNVSVYDSRINMGEILFEEHPVDADIVVGSPDSGMIAALGFSRASGIKYEKAIVRNRYIGRTFILPNENMIRKGIKIKLVPIKHLINGKRVVLVDDSIVRGNTIKRVIEILKESGASEIHIRIASPQVINSESLTFDVPSEDRLISHGRSVEEVRRIIGADSLGFISIEGLRRACGNKEYYEQCFGGNNPINTKEQRCR